MDAALEVALGSVPADELIATMPADAAADPGVAYAMAKRANMARVRAAAIPYGAVGARVVSISPGIIATGMGRQELDAQPVMHDMLAASPIQRIGTPDDIAAAVEWLASPAASFITGTDLRVDGGVTAQVTMQPPTL
jgi:NAD(P)-dependent dehydrogenase (short-subunit alcohol dehydrogenase family)